MSSSRSDPALAEPRARLLARWEAVETVRARELATLSEERSRLVIAAIGAVEAWRERPDWSGLVEQQALLKRGRQR